MNRELNRDFYDHKLDSRIVDKTSVSKTNMVACIEVNKMEKYAPVKAHKSKGGIVLENGGGGGNRTRVRKSSALGSTCVALSLDFSRSPSDRQDN